MRAGKKKVTFRGTMANADWIALFDRAATGDLDAIMKLAEGYLLRCQEGASGGQGIAGEDKKGIRVKG